MNFLQTLIDFLGEFWPLVIVDQWEHGCYYVIGRAKRRVLKPGVYPIIPWFMDVETVSVVPTPISTPLLNITLKDGKTLSYSLTAVIQVDNAYRALNTIDDYKESVGELIASKASEKLADVEAARVDPEGRRRLLGDLLRWCDAETEQYGVRVHALRFTNFAINQRAYRFLVDTALGSLDI